MTVGKSALLTAGLVAVFALGIMSGPTIREHWSKVSAPEAAVATPAAEASAEFGARTVSDQIMLPRVPNWLGSMLCQASSRTVGRCFLGPIPSIQ